MGVRELRKALIAGQENFLPPAYQRCDYLESINYNARIDTGVSGNDDTLIIDGEYMIIDRSGYSGIIGNYTSETTSCWRIIQPAASANNPRFIYVNTSKRQTNSGFGMDVVTLGETIFNNRFRLLLKADSAEAWSKINDYHNLRSISEVTPSGGVSERTIAIAASAPASTSTASTVVRKRFYNHLKIWSHGKLVRNYVPCYRKSDNKAGFYDTVNHTFNPSIGSVDFTAGNDTN